MTIYVGIADAHGIESFIPESEARVDLLQLRAACNRQRHAVVYEAELEEEQARPIRVLCGSS